MTIIKASNEQDLAKQTAFLTFKILKRAIDQNNQAVWVLAGGNTPLLSYQVLARDYVGKLDWSKVWFLIGDERQVKLDDADSNWRQAEAYLISRLPVLKEHLIQPIYSSNLETMAQTYEDAFNQIAKINDQLFFDLIWLGIGEDGHTLSLFPKRNLKLNRLVMPVSNAPKAPSSRISLTIKAMSLVKNCLILSSGSHKTKAINNLLNQHQTVPISRVVKNISDNKGKVWLLEA
jgi:6-phosphogluconolactonase